MSAIVSRLTNAFSIFIGAIIIFPDPSDPAIAVIGIGIFISIGVTNLDLMIPWMSIVKLFLFVVLGFAATLLGLEQNAIQIIVAGLFASITGIVSIFT